MGSNGINNIFPSILIAIKNCFMKWDTKPRIPQYKSCMNGKPSISLPFHKMLITCIPSIAKIKSTKCCYATWLSSITVWCRYNALNFLTNIHKRYRIAHLLGQGMGCLKDSASDWYSASVPAIIYAISDYIGPSYNGTWLYKVCCNINTKRHQAFFVTK